MTAPCANGLQVLRRPIYRWRFGALLRTIVVILAFGLVQCPLQAARAAEERPSGAHCEDGLQCFSLASVSGPAGHLVDVSGMPSVSADGNPSTTWSAVPGSDSSFTFMDAETGKCLDANSGLYPYPLDPKQWMPGRPSALQTNWRVAMYGCNGGARQQWFFQPLPGPGGFYYIRNVATGHCLSRVNGTSSVEHAHCKGASTEQWVLEAVGADTAQYRRDATALAAAYGATQCKRQPRTCTYEKTGQSATAAAGMSCVSDPHYNDTATDENYAFHLSHTTAFTWGFSQQLSIGIDTGLMDSLFGPRISASFSLGAGQQWTSGDDTGTATTFTVPPHSYGYVLLVRVTSAVTSRMTFDASGDLPWTMDETTQVLVKDTPAGSTYYRDVTSTSAPLCQDGIVHRPEVAVSVGSPHTRPVGGVRSEPSAAQVLSPGDRVSYDIDVGNTGDVRLDEITLAIPKLQNAGVSVSCPRTFLDPADIMTCHTGFYTVTDDDAADGWLTVTATATTRFSGSQYAAGDTLSIRAAPGPAPRAAPR